MVFLQLLILIYLEQGIENDIKNNSKLDYDLNTTSLISNKDNENIEIDDTINTDELLSQNSQSDHQNIENEENKVDLKEVHEKTDIESTEKIVQNINKSNIN